MKDLLPLLKEAAGGLNGRAQIKLMPGGFKLGFTKMASPHGLTVERMPELGKKYRGLMREFVERLAKASGTDLSVAKEFPSVTFHIEGKSLAFLVEATVKGDLTEEDIEVAQPTMYRYGYSVEVW